MAMRGHPTELCFFNNWNARNTDVDVNVVLRGMRRFDPPTDKINILWVISHPSAVTDEECASYDWVFVASNTLASTWKEKGRSNVSVLLQATDHHRFYPGDVIPDKAHDILFVGNRHKGKIRKVVDYALMIDANLSVYGGNWDGLVPAKNIAGITIPNDELGAYYRSAGVVLNDHWDDMASNGILSNRAFDVLASGRPLITDRINGFPSDLEDLVYFYDDPETLAIATDAALSEPKSRAVERQKHALTVIERHSFARSAEELEETIGKVAADRSIPYKPRDYSFCVVTCVKNEGPFLLEWVAHNRAIGVSDFLIFSNDCDDGTAEILDRLDELGVIRHLPNPSTITGGSPHTTCLRYAPFHKEFERSDYIVVIDVDEFITVSSAEGTLNSLVKENGAPDVISLSELIFGFGGVAEFTDEPVMEQFRYSNDLRPGKARARRGVKSIIRNGEKIRAFTNHRPVVKQDYYTSVHWVDGSGRPVAPDFISGEDRGFDCRGCYQNAIVNHFTLRSGETMLAKFDRGDAVKRDRLNEKYFRRRNHNRLRVDHVAAVVPLCRAGIAEFMADTKLADAHNRSVTAHKSKIERLKKEPGTNETWKDILSVVEGSAPKVDDDANG